MGFRVWGVWFRVSFEGFSEENRDMFFGSHNFRDFRNIGKAQAQELGLDVSIGTECFQKRL